MTLFDVVLEDGERIAEYLHRPSAKNFVAAWNSREIGARLPATMLAVLYVECPAGEAGNHVPQEAL